MAPEVVTPLTTEKPRPAKATPAAAGPATTLTVPAKPAIVTGANVATLAGTAAAAAGPVGWAVAAGVAAVAGGGYAVRRAFVRRDTSSDGHLGRGGGAGRSASGQRSLGGARSSGAGRAGRSAGAAAGGRRRGGAASTAGGAGRHAAGRAGTGRGGAGSSTAGRRGSGLGALNPMRALASRRAAGRGPAGSTAAGRSRAASGPLGRAGRSVGALGRGAGRLASAPARAAWRAAKQHRANRRANHATGGQSSPGVWQRMRRFVRGNVLGHKPPTAKPANPKTTPTDRRHTGGTVRRPTQPTDPSGRRAPAPRPTTRTSERTPTMGDTQTAGGPQPTSPFFHAARQVHATAAKFEPRGMMEVRGETYEMPHSLDEIAAALRVRAQACTKQPLHPQLAHAIAQVAACVDSAAQAARQLGPAFDALHPTEVARILKPRPNEQAWDVANNRP